MAAQLNHTIVWSSDQRISARFLAEMLGRPAPTRFGHFDVVKLDNGVSLDFANAEGPIRSQHHCAGRRRAFSFMPSLSARQISTLSSGRIHKRRIDHWADPMRRHPGEINHTD